MATPIVIELLNELAELKAELAPMLRKAEELEAEIKAKAKRYKQDYESTEEVEPGKVLRVSASSRVFWSEKGLRELAMELGATKAQIEEHATPRTFYSIRKVKA